MQLAIPIMEGVLVASLGIIVALLYRHRGHWFVTFDDLEQHEREYHRKKELIVRKVERQVADSYKRALTYIRPVGHITKEVGVRWYHRLVELEQKYRKTVKALQLTGPQRVERITTMLDEADGEVAKENWEGAESKLIEVLTLQNTHLRAYEGLAEVYWNMGKWKEAMETYKFVSRLLKDKTPIGYLHRWAEAAKNCERYNQAIKALTQALELEPNNPRSLDLLVENAILAGNPDLAAGSLEALKAANPDNQKIGEFEKRIATVREMQSHPTPR